MLKPVTNMSTKNATSHIKEDQINPAILLDLRRQRLEERLEAIEPCLFKHTDLLTQKYYRPSNDEETPNITTVNANNTQNISLPIKLKA